MESVSRIICRLIVASVVCVFLVGCDNTPTGPPTVEQKSSPGESLNARIKFVKTYINFDRKFEKLEYDIAYYNNGGGWVPGPSDWDIQIVGVVPENQIDLWVDSKAVRCDRTAPTDWLNRLASEIPVNGVAEWYLSDGAMIGVDRRRRIVAFRDVTAPTDVEND